MYSRLLKSIVTVALIALSLSASAAPEAQVLVRPVCQVSGPDVKVGDVASVECSDAALAGELKSVPICSSPMAGKTRQVSRGQIVVALRRQGLADSADVLSPEQIAVTRVSTTVDGHALFEMAQKYALSSGNWPGTVVVEPARMPVSQVVPAGKLELRVSSRAQKIHKGRNTLPVEIVVDGSVCAITSVTALVRVFAPALVAKQSIKRNTEITSENTMLEDHEITNLPDDVLRSFVEGQMASVPIPEGSVIRQDWVSAPPAVRAGDSVTVIAVGGSVRVSDRGIAANDAAVGGRVKVRLGGEAREVHGKVVGPGTVEILIGERS
jgi:flagella basal body P-ring formation protein FlgA